MSHVGNAPQAFAVGPMWLPRQAPRAHVV